MVGLVWLAANGLQYLADNVVLMMLAASISLVGVTAIDKEVRRGVAACGGAVAR